MRSLFESAFIKRRASSADDCILSRSILPLSAGMTSALSSAEHRPMDDLQASKDTKNHRITWWIYFPLAPTLQTNRQLLSARYCNKQLLAISHLNHWLPLMRHKYFSARNTMRHCLALLTIQAPTLLSPQYGQKSAHLDVLQDLSIGQADAHPIIVAYLLWTQQLHHLNWRLILCDMLLQTNCQSLFEHW